MSPGRLTDTFARIACAANRWSLEAVAAPILRVPSPNEADNDCYVSAVASFLGLSYWHAYVLLWGGPPPPMDSWCDFRMHYEDVTTRLAKIGLRVYRGRPENYTRLRKPALVFVYWPPDRCVPAGHVVVWDGKRRVDPSGYDTVRRHKGMPFRVLVAA